MLGAGMDIGNNINHIVAFFCNGFIVGNLYPYWVPLLLPYVQFYVTTKCDSIYMNILDQNNVKTYLFRNLSLSFLSQKMVISRAEVFENDMVKVCSF